MFPKNFLRHSKMRMRHNLENNKSGTCDQCLHREVCKFLHGEMIKHNYWGKDFINELKDLKKHLADKCKDYVVKTVDIKKKEEES